MALALVCGQTGRFLRQAGRQLLSLVPRENVGPVRNYYVDWRMLRDVKRRKMAFEYADERRRLNAIRKNTILPKELQLPALEEEDIIDLEAPFTDLEIKTAMLEMPNGRGECSELGFTGSVMAGSTPICSPITLVSCLNPESFWENLPIVVS
ncbi:small ribosomal subunit protein uS14m isoform X1 [Narcine bancroftii]|uniref:small ribosomal subunit protein uS14m isoform X1 n=1 Tax=Narcine bancroftii TaxID=1343680 RepID=UPI003831F61E